MGTSTTRDLGTDAPRRRVLVVADWAIDPHGVVEVCERRMDDCALDFTFLVPAWLHGLGWPAIRTGARPVLSGSSRVSGSRPAAAGAFAFPGRERTRAPAALTAASDGATRQLDASSARRSRRAPCE